VSDFVNLHVHGQRSELDGLTRTSQQIEAALADGQRAVTITDHGDCGAHFDVNKSALAAGLTPILGLEAYLSIGPRTERNVVRVPAEDDFDGGGDSDGATKEKRYEHLTLLAANPTGWRNLIAGHNASWDAANFFYKPRWDYDLLAAHSAGLIVGSGCLGGPVAGPLIRGDMDTARTNLARLRDIFGEANLFVEVMDHDIPAERKVIPGLVDLAREFNLPLVATNDSHYAGACDAPAHDAWLAIGSSKGSKTTLVTDEKRFRFNGTGYHLRTAAEMHALFDTQPGTERAVSNSLLIASRIEKNVIPAVGFRLPHVPVPDGHTEQSWLYKLVKDGLIARYGPVLTEQVKNQARLEMDTIVGAGFAGYLLAVHDIVSEARRRGIRVGPGRGSGPGSICLYALEVTNVEPLGNGLLFERFLNPDRPSMPDVDIDFQSDRRDEMYEYAAQKYGPNFVARIGAPGMSWAKKAIRDIGRVTGRDELADTVARLVPNMGTAANSSFHVLLDEDEPLGAPLRAMMQEDPAVAALVADAQAIEGVTSSSGIHACGFVIGDQPLTDLVPMRQQIKAPGAPPVTEWDGRDIEKFGLVKFDFLAIDDLTVVQRAVEMIEELTGEKIDPDNATHDPSDERAARAYAMLAAGKTAGVFQLSSSGMTELCKAVKPTSLADLSALVALYRPGPMGAGMHHEYAHRKNGAKVDYGIFTPVPAEQAEIATVLGNTMGTCVAEGEQVYSSTWGGYVPIEQIRAGDLVQSVGDDGQYRLSPVSHVHDNGIKSVVKVTFDSGRSIRVTADHLLLTRQGWTQAGDLKAESRVASPVRLLRNADEDSPAQWWHVLSVKPDGAARVYDLTVPGDHNFVAEGVVVHNCVYQEQLMQLAEVVADFSKDEKFRLQKAFSKKIKPEMDALYETFLSGGQRSVRSDGSAKVSFRTATLDELWRTFTASASYLFNRCLTGDTMVVDGNGAPWTISELFGMAGAGTDLPETLRAFDHRSNTFTNQALLTVHDNGTAEVYRMTLANGRTARCTGNHRWLCVDPTDRLGVDGDPVPRYRELSELSVGDLIVTDDGLARLVPIESIERDGSMPTFDLEMADGTDHNFVANGMVSHNSHSAAYGQLAWMTAWLKANWPGPYGAALLSVVPTDKSKAGKRQGTIAALRAEGVDVLPPDVNVGAVSTAAYPDGTVRLGLGEVKGVSGNAQWIVVERDKNGPFTSLADLMNRVHVPRGEGMSKLPTSAVIALIEAGAMDGFGPRMGQVMAVRAASGSDDVVIPDAEWGVIERSERQRRLLGVVLGPPPTALLADQLDAWVNPATGARTGPIGRVSAASGVSVSVVGQVVSVNIRSYTKGRYARVVIEDATGRIEGIAWNNVLERLTDSGLEPVVGQIIGVSGVTTAPWGSDDEGDVTPELRISNIWTGDLRDGPRRPTPICALGSLPREVAIPDAPELKPAGPVVTEVADPVVAEPAQPVLSLVPDPPASGQASEPVVEVEATPASEEDPYWESVPNDMPDEDVWADPEPEPEPGPAVYTVKIAPGLPAFSQLRNVLDQITRHYPTFDWALILDDGQSSDPFPHAGGGPALVLVGADDAGDPVAMIRPVLAA